jgi:hypothetical protein
MLRGSELVVKLPKEQVDQLVLSGRGGRFDPRRDGRLMREWVTIFGRRRSLWEQLASQAREFVRQAR